MEEEEEEELLLHPVEVVPIPFRREVLQEDEDDMEP